MFRDLFRVIQAQPAGKSLHLVYAVALLVVLVLSGVVPNSAVAQCVTCVWHPPLVRAVCAGDATGWTICWTPSQYECQLQGLCGGSGSCFLAGAEILSTIGVVPIEQLEVGADVVQHRADDDDATARVVNKFQALHHGYYIVNGSIRVTGEHPFLVGDLWVEAQHLRVGDRLTGRDGDLVVVTRVEFVDDIVRVFNIDVDGSSTFVVDGVIVHNKQTPGEG